MTTVDMDAMCTKLEAEFDNISPMHDGNEELTVYLPLDEGNNPDPEDIGERVMQYLQKHGFSARHDLDGQVIVAEAGITEK